LNPCDPTDKRGRPIELGIPFYLPKPLLIVAKNFRNVEEAKVGLTDSAPIPNYLDDQAKYADVNARTSWTPVHMTAGSGGGDSKKGGGTGDPQGGGGGDGGGATAHTATASGPRVFAGGAPISPNVVPPDGLTPDTFYTYQIVFVPDLTQKYGLRIRGGAGELRAAMNMVNGWMFTGLGPFYMKDSSTAQNVLADGIAANLTLGGAADVINSVQSLRAAAAKGGGTGEGVVTPAQIQEVHEKIVQHGFTRDNLVTMSQYAEIHVFEPYLTPEGQMEWRPVTELSFDRQFLGTVQPRVRRDVFPLLKKEEPKKEEPKKDGAKGAATGESLTPAAAPTAVATPTQVNVNCGPAGACPAACEPFKGPILRMWDACKPKRTVTDTRVGDGEFTPEQLDALINAGTAGVIPTLPAPTTGTQRTPPPVTLTGLPNIKTFGGTK
jgi:hypothetical protein